MSLNIPNAPNAGLFKGGYNKFVTPSLPAAATYLLPLPTSHAGPLKREREGEREGVCESSPG